MRWPKWERRVQEEWSACRLLATPMGAFMRDGESMLSQWGTDGASWRKMRTNIHSTGVTGCATSTSALLTQRRCAAG